MLVPSLSVGLVPQLLHVPTKEEEQSTDSGFRRCGFTGGCSDVLSYVSPRLSTAFFSRIPYSSFLNGDDDLRFFLLLNFIWVGNVDFMLPQ
jgi:hypothetical protein